jgi:tetratricopeptide (TPR) repeat protein
MLTGKNPFQRSTAVDTISAILRDEPERVSNLAKFTPVELSKVVEKVLSKNPEERYSSARDFETALKKLQDKFQDRAQLSTEHYALASSEKLALPGQETDRLPQRGWRNRWMLVLILLLPFLLMFLGSRFLQQANRTMTQAGPALIAVMAIDNKTSDRELAQADVGKILADAFLQILYDCKGIQIVSPLRIQSIVSNQKKSFSDTAKDPELVQEVCRVSNANTILSGTLSQIGNTFILNASLTQLPGENLIANFQAESNGKSQLLESLTSGIAPKLKQTLSKQMGIKISGGRPLGDIATDSFSAYTYYVKGSDFNKEGKWREGAEQLNLALQIDPAMGAAWSELACSYSFAGEDAKAQAAQRKAIDLRSHMTRKEQVWVDANSRWFTGNGEAYRAKMQEFLKEFPDDRMGYFYIGLSWEWLDQNCKEAVRYYQKSIELTPDYYPLTKALVDCYLKLQQKEKAVQALEQYLNLVRSGYGHDQAKARLAKISPVS